jgi:glutamine synthetase
MTATFVERHGLWSDAQRAAAEEIRRSIESRGIETVRVSFPDQHGILRGKTFVRDAFLEVLDNGCGLVTTLLLKDIAHKTAFPVWQTGGGLDIAELTCASDFIVVPDPVTFRTLPWVERGAWVMGDSYFRTGRPVPFATRRILQGQVAQLAAQGYAYRCGIELEFSVYRIADANLTHADCGQPATPPSVTPLAHGFQYLTETRYDELSPVLELLREALQGLGLPLRSMESEFGPSQVELTFNPLEGSETADAVVLARSAIKQVCRRHGYHATFMCRPALANAFSNGWHLHQSLVEHKGGANAFLSARGDAQLSPLGANFMAGLLAHAKEACIFAAPTVNGYKRYRPFTLAPNRIVWGTDNRGAMIRVIGSAGDASTHIENRIGEPGANPYLYLSSQLVCGMEGIRRGLAPPAAVDRPYDDNWERLPRNLAEAIAHLRASALFRRELGDQFIDYFIALKEFELHRFLSEEVTDWEQREYFEML